MIMKTLPKLLQFQDGEPEPIYVLSKDIGKIVLGWTPAVLADLRRRKVGPRFYRQARTTVYAVADIKAFLERDPVETFNKGDE